MSYRRWIRIGLGYLAIVSAQIGFWALLAPRSFYDDFPGLGRSWISIDGPYNEHLIRDVGALNLALLLVIAIAVVSMARVQIVTAALAAMVWGTPHVVYHAFNTDGLDGVDIVGTIGGLLLFAGLPIALIWASGRIAEEAPTPGSGAPRS